MSMIMPFIIASTFTLKEREWKRCLVLAVTIKRQANVKLKTAKQICRQLSAYADESLDENCYEYEYTCPDVG